TASRRRHTRSKRDWSSDVCSSVLREAESVLLFDQREAIAVTQFIGARELSRKGVGDAQMAVSKVSGISKQEGVKNVFVRGLGDRSEECRVGKESRMQSWAGDGQSQ